MVIDGHGMHYQDTRIFMYSSKILPYGFLIYEAVAYQNKKRKAIYGGKTLEKNIMF